MAYQTITVENADHISLIRLNRPEALNALNAQLIQELGQAVQEADQSDKIRCIVITGSDKAFAAGADVTEMADKGFVDVRMGDLFGHSIRVIEQCRTPIIAAVAGYALGGGCELAMICDMIICADNAKFGQPEINLGIMAGIGGTQRLTRFVGKSKAMEMHLTGRFMDADEAERSGLVSRVVPAKKLMEDVMATAAKIAEKSTVSLQAAKQAVNYAYEVPMTQGIAYERAVFHSLFATEDQKEGMAAFVEKRQPQFRDK